MNMPLSSDAFDVHAAHPLAQLWRSQTPASNRVGAGIITIIAHIAVIAALAAGMHIVQVIQPHAIIVHLDPIKQKPEDLAPPPPPPAVPFRPPILTVPVPDVVIATAPSAIIAVPTPARPSPPPAPTATPTRVTGKGRSHFIALLLDHLNRFKRYPAAARKAHIEGVVMLHFVMDPSGKVLSFEIAKSSGRPVLDNEALALIQRAQPLPALPPGMNRLDAIVPIEFSLTG